MNLRRTISFAVAGVVLFPSAGHAHLVSSGMGPFYDGVAHLFVSPDDLFGVVALALLAGLNGARFGRLLIVVLPASWIAGSGAGLLRTDELVVPALSALTLVAIGGFLAAAIHPRAGVFLSMASAFGLFHGYLNGTAVAQGGLGLTGVLGIGLAVFAVGALVAAFAVPLRAYWIRIAIRVAGSWIAAIGLLMAGWALKR